MNETATEAKKLLFTNPNLDNLSSLDLLDREDLIEIVKKMVSGGVSLSFYGKRTAAEIDRKVTPRQVRILKNYCVGSHEEQAKNYIVEGENLQALVTLYKFRGQVDLILTDPPYNTGEDFRYNDKWDSDPNDPELGLLVAKEDGARHTKWMKAMLPRLNIMKAMLKSSGVIAICIDHRELFNLGLLMNEVFGEENRLAIINWQKSYSPKNQDNHVSSGTEYVLVYAKEKEFATTDLLPREEAMNKRFNNPDGDKEPWKGADTTANQIRKTTIFGIQSPFTGYIHYPERVYTFDGDIPKPKKHWACATKTEIKNYLEDFGIEYILKDIGDQRGAALVIKGSKIKLTKYDPSTDATISKSKKIAEDYCKKNPYPRFCFSADKSRRFGFGRPFFKLYLSEVKRGKVPMTFWADDDYDQPQNIGAESWNHTESGHSQTGINELDSILGKTHNFQTVKPLKLFKKIIQLWCPPNGLVLDPYAGSGTTGHAILEFNNEVEGTDRRFILIEQGAPEKGDKYARSLTYERLKRVIEGVRINNQGKPIQTEALKGGFKYLLLTQKIDVKAVMSMKKEDLIDIVIVSHWDDNKRKSNLIRIENPDYKYLVGKNESNNGYFLIWNGGDAVESFDEETYETVVKEARKEKLTAPYYVYARHEFYQTNTVIFNKIPDKILAHLGLNESSGTYHQEEEAGANE